MNKPSAPYQPNGDYTNQWAFTFSITIFFLMCSLIFFAGFYSYRYNFFTKQVDVVVVDKYEGLKQGTTKFYIETCLKNDIKRCELDTFSRRDYDMINIGEQWTLEVRNHEY